MSVDQFKNIQSKLEGFIKKYYTNELIKGVILFFAIGLLYFLCTLFVEYMLWLNPTFRAILFWLFVGVELALIIKFIAIPIARLLKLQQGIDYETASKIIGKHFPQVNDKLLNVLQLQKNPLKSELLLASINQKSAELSPIPFKLAINFKSNVKYLKYAALPMAIILMSFISGKFNMFTDSFKRVVHYRTAYQPPAPFQFHVANNELKSIENANFTLRVMVSGEVIPENVEIHYNNQLYVLQQKRLGEFEYVFSQPKDNIRFQLTANNISSKPYELQVIPVPSLLGFEMRLNYPKYIKKPVETLKSTGNANVPEGTSVTWLLSTKATDSVQLVAEDTLSFLKKDSGVFELSKKLYNDLNYSISTSNNYLKHYENLSFYVNVIKDQRPELKIKMQTDSLDLQTLYFYGQVSDDYGFSKLQLVYYPTDNDSEKYYQEIPVSSSNISEFITAFPNDLNIKEGVAYSLYFQVFDNDALHHYKSTKSNVFTYRKRTKSEEEQKQLIEQSKTIKDLNNSLKTFDEQDKQLEELSKTQKEKTELNFNDKKKLESFFKRQKQQDDLMKHFNKQLKDNLENFQKDQPKDDAFKKDLEKRLQENEDQLKEDEKLLEELQRLQDKINREQFAQKLEELAKQNKNKKRSLEQLLELTKRFYVGKKLEKIQQQLEDLSTEQEQLANEQEDQNTKNKQDDLNQAFDAFKKQMDQIEKDNKALKKPLEIPRDKLDEKEVDEDQQNASDELEKQQQTQDQQEKKQSNSNAVKSQKKAALKMKQISKKMAKTMQTNSGEQLQEDANMLRQILDNLLLFSFDQEALMNAFKTIEANHNQYAAYLRKQSDLKEHFKHIDDSLFALSLREPKLSETVNKEIADVYFNIDKSLDQFADNQIGMGVSHQQFTITAANNLSNFLSDVLDNMNEQLKPSSGQGQGGVDLQLPDIIMSQEELNKMMQDGIKKGKEGKEGKATNNKENEQEGNGNNDSDNELLYQIYQKQEALKQALEDQLSKEGKKDNGDNLLRKMEDIETDLLNKGFSDETLQKMMQLQHQLLKLDNATFQQGFDNKRQSTSNTDTFTNNTNNQIPTAKEYFNSTEILNRQTLPLQELYKKKVQEYFKNKDDKL